MGGQPRPKLLLQFFANCQKKLPIFLQYWKGGRSLPNISTATFSMTCSTCDIKHVTLTHKQNTALCRTSHFCLAFTSLGLLPDGETERKSQISCCQINQKLRWQQFSALPSPDILTAYCHALVDLSSEPGVQWARSFMRLTQFWIFLPSLFINTQVRSSGLCALPAKVQRSPPGTIS